MSSNTFLVQKIAFLIEQFLAGDSSSLASVQKPANQKALLYIAQNQVKGDLDFTNLINQYRFSERTWYHFSCASLYM